MSRIDRATELGINRAVRRVFIKHWIDLGRIAVRAHGTTVTIYGHLQYLPGTQGELRSETVNAMFQEINRIQQVKRLVARLENWQQDGGLWHQVQSSPAAGLLRKPTD